MDAAVRLVAKKPPGDLRRVERLPHLVAALRSGGAFDLRILPVVPFSAPRESMSMVEGAEITASRGVIATGPAEAARAGGRVFERRGNAMDAAAAACLACAVLEPQAVDLGGYVAAGVVLEGASGRVWSIDANSVAPAAARQDMYRVLPKRAGPPGINELEYDCSVADDANVYGALAV